MDKKQKLERLTSKLEHIYHKQSKKLLYHGWHHIIFVRNKAVVFAKSIDADLFLVESAALVHDLNYIVKKNSEPEEADVYRRNILISSGYSHDEIIRIEKIIMESHTLTRNKKISNEGKSLSDADTLFKALPITPILFANKYIAQNGTDIRKLARKITSEQNKLLDEGIYFYTSLAKKKYLNWAKSTLALWNNVEDALRDEDVSEMLRIAKNLEVI
ncbi:MAG: HD family phosphohydrolase [Candidatus Woesearchaeota archaeon]